MRTSRRLTSLGAVIVTAVTAGATWMGAAAGGGPQRDDVNPRAAAVQAFATRVKAYLDLRGNVESGLPKIHETDDPTKLHAREAALGEAVRAVRADAKEGDLFGPDMSPLLIEIIRKDWRRRAPRDRAALQVEMPKPFVPKVNMTYPSTHPLVTFPPMLLRQLHQLPEGLEYRFVGRHVILRDVKANLIVDVLRDVLP